MVRLRKEHDKGGDAMTRNDRRHDDQSDAQMLDRAARHIRLKVGEPAPAAREDARPAEESSPAASRRPARGPVPVAARR
jgi:hypothetical protein